MRQLFSAAYREEEENEMEGFTFLLDYIRKASGTWPHIQGAAPGQCSWAAKAKWEVLTAVFGANQQMLTVFEAYARIRQMFGCDEE